MISMTDFQQIIQFRNQGFNQDEIAKKLGISRRSVIRYLGTGKIPIYQQRVKRTKKDPLENFYKLIEEKFSNGNGKDILLSDLFELFKGKGYKGSIRTLRRKTFELRKKFVVPEIFFQRETIPGEIMEGDFTEMHIDIGGIQQRIYLWVSSLPYSNSYFANAFYHCTFECFAEGTVNAFYEFGGVAKKYRLDNLSPAVSKILKGHDRKVTKRFAELQSHFGFMQDFCNPAKGNEKGNVEANNKWLKKKIYSAIALNKLSFINLAAFDDFVISLCRAHNSLSDVQTKKTSEVLAPLPKEKFNCFKTEIVKINKYSLFSLRKTGHMYSAPSSYAGLSLEARVFPNLVCLVSMDKIICTHKRIYGLRGLVSIFPEHIIEGLAKKPNAMANWKYRHVLFERPAWTSFYERLKKEGATDKEYLRCLKLLTKHGREVVTVGMELMLDDQEDLSFAKLEKLITNDLENVTDIKPLIINLHHYDELITGGKNESEHVSRP